MGGINAADANENPNERQLEASEAYDVFNAGGTNDPFEQVIVVIGGAPGATGDPAFKTAVGDVVAQLRAASAPLDGVQTPTFDQLTDPFSAPPEAGLVSPDGSTVRIVGRIDGDDTRVVPLIAPVLPILDGARAANPGLAIHAISSTFINDDINALISEGLDDSLRLTIPLTFIILLFAFGAIVAAIVPLVLAITSLVAAFGILGIYSQVVGAVSPNATQLIVLIGLAVAVDYSLFMITRFRVERRAGRDRAKAIEVSSSTAGRAVFFSGLAVMISLAGLITLGVSLFTSMAIGTISVVFVSVVGSLTFLPATLSILGDRVNLGRPAAWLPRLAAALPIAPVRRWGTSALAWLDRRAAQQEGSGFWGRLVTRVMAHPVPMTIVSVAFLLLLASPVLQLRTGITDITAFPDSIDGVAGIKLLNEKWPQGTELHLQVVVTNADQPETQAAIERLKTEGLAIAGLHEPVEVTPSHDGKVAMVSFTMGGGQNDEANRAIVLQARTQLAPAVFGSLPGGPGAGHRRCRVLGRRDQDLRRRHPADLRLRARAVVPADARRLPLDRHPDQGDPAQPAVSGGRVRRPRAGLPGRLAGRTAGDHAERGDRELGPAVHLHDPVRAVDGLPPVHPHPHQGGARPGPRLAGGGRQGHLRDRRRHHQRGVDHGRRLRGLHRPEVRLHPAARAGPRGRGVHRRDASSGASCCRRR